MNRIKILRRENHETQRDLAQHLGVRQSTVSQWEKNLYNPDNKYLFMIADRYGVGMDYLLGYTDSREIVEPDALKLLREYLLLKTDREFSEEELERIDRVVADIIELSRHKRKK